MSETKESEENEESPRVLGSHQLEEPIKVPACPSEPLEKYSQEVIHEMKMMGFTKPDDLSWGDWLFSGEPSHIHDLIILHAAHGMNQRTIAKEVGRTEAWLSTVMGNSEIQKEIRRKQDELFGKDARKRISNMLNSSLDTLDDILRNPQEKASLKADVAKYILDQGIGKAKQDLTVEGNLLAQFLHRLDSEPKSSANLKNTEKLVETNNPIDTFANEFVPEHKVGAKD